MSRALPPLLPLWLLLCFACSSVAPGSGPPSATGQSMTGQSATTQSHTVQSPSGPSAPAPSSAASTPTAWKGFRERPARGHVEVVGAEDTFPPYGELGDTRFLPDDTILDEAEAALPAAIAAEPRSKAIAPRLASYHRQYFGIIRGAKRHVLVNGFCQAEERIREQTIMVKDGGDCFFQALYDVTAKRYEWVRVNGPG